MTSRKQTPANRENGLQGIVAALRAAGLSRALKTRSGKLMARKSLFFQNEPNWS
jgi:hypothetical protein